MKKEVKNPVEKMRLTIEFADNGIILRNPECEDDVMLAVHPDNGFNPHGGMDFTEEYKAIGKKIYNWLTEVAVAEHADHWVSTGATINIEAKLEGRSC